MNLSEIAKKAMMDRGFNITFSPDVLNETAGLAQVKYTKPNHSDVNYTLLKDLRHLPWISIDDEDTFDLDQLTFAETIGNEFVIYVAIADVSHLVKKGSAIDLHAAHNTTSVYTPTIIFPMLPLQLSTHLTSLNPHEDRQAIIVKMKVNPDGAFSLIDLFPGWVHNHEKLSFEGVSAWLQKPNNQIYPILENKLEIINQLLLQDKIAHLIKGYRDREGAINFGITEVEPKIVDGEVKGIGKRVHTRAHVVIENFMIAANVCYTQYLKNRNLPILRRVVRTPKRWDKIVQIAADLGEDLPKVPDPKALRKFLLKQRVKDRAHYSNLSLSIIKLIGKGEYSVGIPGMPSLGHFDLAVLDYAHTTAPNRRFPDLIMQRLLKQNLYNESNSKVSTYTSDELIYFAKYCTQKEDDASKVERQIRKSAAAQVLEPHIGKTFNGIISGSSSKGTWVRLFKPQIEGKVVEGYQGLDVGDRVIVKLVSVNVEQGFIDFVLIS